MRNIDKTYLILSKSGMSYAQICGHLQGILGAIENDPESASEIIKHSVEIATRITKEEVK